MRTTISRLTATDPEVTPLILRLVFAIVIWPHGAQLLLGCFGGHGFTGTMQYFTTQSGLPAVVAFLVIMLEFFGSLFILLGFFTRFFAAASLILFLGMIFTVHQHFGFFMNWFGNAKGEGFEYHLLVIGILLPLIISGAGKASVDALIYNKISNK
jgi:putative oxidoreductase